MQQTPTKLPDIMLLTMDIHGDARGSLCETWRHDWLQGVTFVQDNLVCSHHGALRGLHYQTGTPQGKLITAVQGTIYDVVVDLRQSSRTFGQWLGVNLEGGRGESLWIPQGCAHGFLTLSPHSIVSYKMTTIYDPASQHTITWNDPDLAIEWPWDGTPLLSAKDSAGGYFKDAVLFP